MLVMIEVEEQDKIRIAKSGANKLFEVDYDARQKMSDRRLVELFDRVWSKGLERMVSKANTIPPEEVTRRLLDKHHSFVDSVQEHRSFHYQKAEFIAQLQLFEDNRYKLTQLWRVASSDNHPKTLFVTFSSIEERERFSYLAKNLDISDEELGLQLIRNFMELHPEYKYGDVGEGVS